MSDDIESDLSRDIALGLLFSGLVDNFKGGEVVTFCNQLSCYLMTKYTIDAREAVSEEEPS